MSLLRHSTKGSPLPPALKACRSSHSRRGNGRTVAPQLFRLQLDLAEVVEPLFGIDALENFEHMADRTFDLPRGDAAFGHRLVVHEPDPRLSELKQVDVRVH